MSESHANRNTHPIGAMVQKVGRRARECNAKLQRRSATEIYYSRVTAIETLFDAFQSEQAELCDSELTFRSVLFELLDASAVVLGTALAEREKTEAYYPATPLRLAWTAHASIRAALLGQVKLCLELERKMRSDDERHLQSLKLKMQMVGTLLLDAYLAAIQYSHSHQTNELATLQQEYSIARKLVIGSFAQSSDSGSGLLGLYELIAQQVVTNEKIVGSGKASERLLAALATELQVPEDLCEKHCAYEGRILAVSQTAYT